MELCFQSGKPEWEMSKKPVSCRIGRKTVLPGKNAAPEKLFSVAVSLVLPEHLAEAGFPETGTLKGLF